MQKMLALEVAKELGKSPEKVMLVCKSFHDGLRHLLTNPENVKGGILIHGFLSFNLKGLKLERAINNPATKDVARKQKVLDNLIKNKLHVKKRQTRIKKDDE